MPFLKLVQKIYAYQDKAKSWNDQKETVCRRWGGREGQSSSIGCLNGNTICLFFLKKERLIEFYNHGRSIYKETIAPSIHVRSQSTAQ